MREYETTFIVQPEISDEGRQALCQKLDAALERMSALRLGLEDHGKRKLAYEIRKFQKGHYFTLFFLDVGPSVKEIERLLRLDESVLRFLTVQVNDEVLDIEARKTEAVEQERMRQQRAAERAARDAEEEHAREEAMRESRERVEKSREEPALMEPSGEEEDGDSEELEERE